MPAYEYRCEVCETAFTVIADAEEKAKGLKVKCRNCGSDKANEITAGVSMTPDRMGLKNSGSGPCSCGKC